MMAAMELSFDDAIIDDLNDLYNEVENTCREALEESAPIYMEELKAGLREVIDHEGPSELVDSLHCSKVYENKNADGYHIKIEPRGYSKKKYHYGTSKYGGHYNRIYKLSNGIKAIWKEYGIPGRQPARPFILKAKMKASDAVEEKIQEVYNRRNG